MFIRSHCIPCFTGVCGVKSKIKTSIVIDGELWGKFREKVASERGLRFLSEAVEDAIREELVELLVLEEIEEFLSEKRY